MLDQDMRCMPWLQQYIKPNNFSMDYNSFYSRHAAIFKKSWRGEQQSVSFSIENSQDDRAIKEVDVRGVRIPQNRTEKVENRNTV